MASRKKRSSKISKAKTTKRKTTPVTSRKLSTAAKRRRRVKGKFASGRVYPASSKPKDAKRYFYEDAPGGNKPRALRAGTDFESATKPRSDLSGANKKTQIAEGVQVFARERQDLLNSNVSPKRAEKKAFEFAQMHIKSQTGSSLEDLGITKLDIMGKTGGLSSKAADLDLQTQMKNDRVWRSSERGLYDDIKGIKKASPNEILNQLPPGERQWVEAQTKDGGLFAQGATKGATRRGGIADSTRKKRDAYLRSRVGHNTLKGSTGGVGLTHQQALEYAMRDNRGRPAKSRIPTQEELYGPSGYGGRGSKYEPLAQKGRDLDIGSELGGKRVQTYDEIRQRKPNATPTQIVDIQNKQREDIGDQILRNQRWAHENKRAKFMEERQPGSSSQGPDRVTVFTTTFGKPEVSVPTDSLVGQYVINRRKAVARANNLAPKSQLRGRFPQAVRDLHVIEAATNRTVGAEGAYGLYKRTGWRVGQKASKYYAQPLPVGAQVMYNSSGTPMYDSQGRVRFTEGATRNFRWIPSKGVGYGVYVG